MAMPSVHIYVDAGLRARMDALEGEVNWSRVAAEAFERELDRREALGAEGSQGLEEVVERLARSRARSAGQRERQAREAGGRWAREKAEWDHLLAIEDLAASWERNPERVAAARPEALVAALWRALENEQGPTDETDLAWWLDTLGLPPEPTTAELRAFVEGALALFHLVRARIAAGEGDAAC